MHSALSNVVLASASPRRLELLQRLGLEPRRIPADVDESPADGESAERTVRRLAAAKALAVAAHLDPSEGACVLAADTVVTLDGEVLGKPRDPEDAARMLRTLSARSHEVWTGVHAVGPRGDRGVAVRTRVRFRELSRAWVAWYVATGEPMDKAGAYGIQGAGALLTAGIEGSWSNVVGLPLEALPDLLREVGFAWPVPPR